MSMQLYCQPLLITTSGGKDSSVCLVLAKLAQKSVEYNPTDCEKMGTKRSILTDKKELPLSVVLSGANTHNIKLLEATLDGIVISRPSVREKASAKSLPGFRLCKQYSIY